MNPVDTTSDSKFLSRYAVFLTIIAFMYIAGVTFLPVPEKNQGNANLVLGFLLGTLVSTLVQFYYGTSKSNQTKDQAIQAMLPTGPTSVLPDPAKDKPATITPPLNWTTKP